jgi:hypothetical protein
MTLKPGIEKGWITNGVALFSLVSRPQHAALTAFPALADKVTTTERVNIIREKEVFP